MTNAELLAKIKAEIEKQIKDPQEHCYGISSVNKLRELLSFLSTFESEKPMQEGLEEEIGAYFKDWYVDESDQGYSLKTPTGSAVMGHMKNVARHFAEWGYLRAAEKYDEIEYNRQRAEESVPNDLEKAAMNYIAPIENEDGLWVINFSGQDIKDAFIAGAKWQAEHTPLPEDTVLFNKGVEEGKRLMMEEAVEYEVGMHGEPIEITFDKYVQRARGIFPGDKVRVIVCKKED